LLGSLTCRKAATWDRWLYFPSEGKYAEDFFARKIRRLRPGLNPRTRVPEASMLTTRTPKPLRFHILLLCTSELARLQWQTLSFPSAVLDGKVLGRIRSEYLLIWHLFKKSNISFKETEHCCSFLQSHCERSSICHVLFLVKAHIQHRIVGFAQRRHTINLLAHPHLARNLWPPRMFFRRAEKIKSDTALRNAACNSLYNSKCRQQPAS
jgi:hypothetical protein